MKRRHRRCKNSKCKICLEDHKKLEKRLENLLDDKTEDIKGEQPLSEFYDLLGWYHSWLNEEGFSPETVYGWASEASFADENIDGFIEDVAAELKDR